MDVAALDAWLRAYGAAWEAKDAEAFVALFAEDVRYYWTPFQPKLGRAALAEAFAGAVARQKDVAFRHEVLHASPERGLARWRCELTRPGSGRCVRLEGVLMMVPAQGGLCREFREWWHSDEVP